MGDIIGESSLPSTWCSVRAIVVNSNATPATPIFGDHNQEYPSGTRFLKTIEGNGLLSHPLGFSTPGLIFIENTAPIEDFFEFGFLSDPYAQQMVGRTAATSSSSFVITADAFNGGQQAGLNGTSPVTSIDWFQNLP
jgi:hypothetical protein